MEGKEKNKCQPHPMGLSLWIDTRETNGCTTDFYHSRGSVGGWGWWVGFECSTSSDSMLINNSLLIKSLPSRCVRSLLNFFFSSWGGGGDSVAELAGCGRHWTEEDNQQICIALNCQQISSGWKMENLLTRQLDTLLCWLR
jgi:hypothetical protein